MQCLFVMIVASVLAQTSNAAAPAKPVRVLTTLANTTKYPFQVVDSRGMVANLAPGGTVQGEFLPGTQHVLNFYLLVNPQTGQPYHYWRGEITIVIPKHAKTFNIIQNGWDIQAQVPMITIK